MYPTPAAAGSGNLFKSDSYYRERTDTSMKLLAAALGAALLLSTGCVEINTERVEPRTETRTVDRHGAETVQAEIIMAAGELEVQGGAKALMEADFRYAPESWRPEVKYEVTGFRGRLTVNHPRSSGLASTSEAKWNLRLNEDTPLDLHVKLGAGESRLDLGRLMLRNLDVELGAGALKLDLTGTPKKTMTVKVRGGVGEAVIRLPREIGVEVETHGGIGEITASGLRKSGSLYRTEAAERGNVGMRVSVHGGIGAIRLIAE